MHDHVLKGPKLQEIVVSCGGCQVLSEQACIAVKPFNGALDT